MGLKKSMLDISCGHSIPNSPFFSYSSVPRPAFLGPPRRAKLQNNTLGKRPRSYRHSPWLSEEQPHKRPRRNASEGYACSGHELRPSLPAPQAQPWHQNDRFVRKFNQEELARAVTVTPTVSSRVAQFPFGNDTEFPVHPIFRSLTGLIPELYPSLRLASRLLFSSQALPFFHSLITSPLTFLQPESQYYNVPLTHLAASPYQTAGLPDPEWDLTIQTILSLVPHITFQISPDPRLAVRWAYTERTSPPQHSTTGLASAYRILPQLFPTPAQLHDCSKKSNSTSPSSNPLLELNFRGTNALINISPCFLRALHPHTFPPPSPAQKLRAAFMLAVTLVHELAHAVYMCRIPGAPLIPQPGSVPAAAAETLQPPAVEEESVIPSSSLPPPHNAISLGNGKPFPHPLRTTFIPPTTSSVSATPLLRPAYDEQEPFYATHRKSELGHAWETTILGGGKLLSLASCDAFSIGLGWQRWPDADEFYVRNYRGEIVPLSRMKTEAGEGGAPKWETVYVVSDAWVWKWFLREFWERVEVEGFGGVNGTGLGRVEKGLGARVRNYDWIEGGGDGWNSDCSSEGRGADGKGVVRVGQTWVNSEGEDDEGEDEYDG